MTTTTVAVFAGALLGIALISRIPIWALGAWKDRSLFRLSAAHLFTYVVVSVASAYGLADGGPPRWNVGFLNCVLPSLLVFLLDVIAMVSRRMGERKSGAPAWFIHSEGKQSGPVATDTVQASLADGSVKSSDWIWRNGFKEWVQIEAVDLTKAVEEAGAIADATNNEPNYFLRHWRGALSLPVSYWVSGAAIAILFIVPYLILMRLELADHPYLIGVTMIGLWLTLAAALTWLGVGIFRSADQYAAIHPKHYWASAAKIMTVIGALAAVAVFVRQGVPQVQEFANLFSASEPRYALQLLRNDTELELKGPMVKGLSAAVADKLKDHPAVVTLHLTSAGGVPAEADKLKDIVLQKSLNTYVPASCSSACVTVFAAGKTRWLSRSAAVALNRPYFADAKPSDLQDTTVKTRAFLLGRGVNAAFVDRALSAPHDQSWQPTHAELFAAGLATSYATDAEVAVAGIPVREIEDAQKALDKIDLYQVLRTNYPQAHSEVAAILRSGYIEGQSPAQMRKRMWTIVLPIVSKSMASASDAALVSFYQIAADEAEALWKRDAQSCEAFLKGKPDGFDPSLLSTELQERELAAMAELIRSSGSYTGKPIESKDVQPHFLQLAAASKTSGFSSANFQQAIQFKLDPARNCQGMILFLRSLLGMSDPNRTALLRFMAQQSGT